MAVGAGRPESVTEQAQALVEELSSRFAKAEGPFAGSGAADTLGKDVAGRAVRALADIAEASAVGLQAFADHLRTLQARNGEPDAE